MYTRTVIIAVVIALGIGNVAWAAEYFSNKAKSLAYDEPISRREVKLPVYDITLYAYDKAFAEEFGLQEQNIEPLQKGLRYLSIKMRTEGEEPNCYYQAILDGDVKVAFPEEDYVNLELPNFRLPYKDNNSMEIRTHIHELLIKKIVWDLAKHYENKVYLANYNFGPDIKDGGLSTLSLEDLKYNRAGYTIFSAASYGCIRNANIFGYPKPALWIAKIDRDYLGGDGGYQNFHQFLFPPKLVANFLPIIKEYHTTRRSVLYGQNPQ
jgi:hypothetical protein